MFRKLLIFTATTAIAAAAFGGVSIAGAQTGGVPDLTVIASHTHFTTADVGPTGDSPGDELVFTATDVNLAGETVGRLDGYCVYTQIANGSDRYEECMLTHTLQGGQITLQGQFQQQAGVDNVFAVTGGTGIYSEARGEAILKFTHRYRFNIDLEH